MTAQETTQAAPEAPKTATREPQDGPRDFQDGPEAFQEAPIRPREAPKTASDSVRRARNALNPTEASKTFHALDRRHWPEAITICVTLRSKAPTLTGSSNSVLYICKYVDIVSNLLAAQTIPSSRAPVQ